MQNSVYGNSMHPLKALVDVPHAIPTACSTKMLHEQVTICN